jgi:hypothetical protein
MSGGGAHGKDGSRPARANDVGGRELVRKTEDRKPSNQLT